MATQIIDGPRAFSPLVRDKDAHREIWVTHLVLAEKDPNTNLAIDGPVNVLNTFGLPQYGDFWNFLLNDVDLWMTCKWDARVSIHEEREGDVAIVYRVEQLFSTKDDSEKCQDQQFEDPLLEPDRISGSFVKYTEEATHGEEVQYFVDDNLYRTVTGPDAPFLTSALEQLRGPQVEFDSNRLNIRIEQTRALLEIGLLANSVDTLNNDVFWGFPARYVKLSNVSWVRKFRGTCSDPYFVRNLEFDIKFDSFDRLVADEGTRARLGRWEMDRNSPHYGKYLLLTDPIPTNDEETSEIDFAVFKDPSGNVGRVVLTGQGTPTGVKILTTPTSTFPTTTIDEKDPGSILLKKYIETDFLLLGVDPNPF